MTELPHGWIESPGPRLAWERPLDGATLWVEEILGGLRKDGRTTFRCAVDMNGNETGYMMFGYGLPENSDLLRAISRAEHLAAGLGLIPAGHTPYTFSFDVKDLP